MLTIYWILILEKNMNYVFFLEVFFSNWSKHLEAVQIYLDF